MFLKQLITVIKKMYVSIFSNDSRYDEVVTIPTDNYNGITFASAMQAQLNSLATLMQNITPHVKMLFNVTYDYTQNKLNITLTDNRDGIIIIGDVLTVKIYSDSDVIQGVAGRTSVNIINVDSINEVISLQNTFSLTNTNPFFATINLRTIRNLYIHSQHLSSNDTVSNFYQDTIVKKILVDRPTNEMIYASMGSAIDYLRLGQRSAIRLQVRLSDKKQQRR